MVFAPDRALLSARLCLDQGSEGLPIGGYWTRVGEGWNRRRAAGNLVGMNTATDRLLGRCSAEIWQGTCGQSFGGFNAGLYRSSRRRRAVSTGSKFFRLYGKFG